MPHIRAHPHRSRFSDEPTLSRPRHSPAGAKIHRWFCLFAGLFAARQCSLALPRHAEEVLGDDFGGHRMNRSLHPRCRGKGRYTRHPRNLRQHSGRVDVCRAAMHLCSYDGLQLTLQLVRHRARIFWRNADAANRGSFAPRRAILCLPSIKRLLVHAKLLRKLRHRALAAVQHHPRAVDLECLITYGRTPYLLFYAQLLTSFYPSLLAPQIGSGPLARRLGAGEVLARAHCLASDGPTISNGKLQRDTFAS
jgi:hypothetical protein